jgi:Cu/Ag efflux pump CusA
VVIVGGTVSAALLALVVLPVVYELLERAIARFGPSRVRRRGGDS